MLLIIIFLITDRHLDTVEYVYVWVDLKISLDFIPWNKYPVFTHLEQHECAMETFGTLIIKYSL